MKIIISVSEKLSRVVLDLWWIQKWQKGLEDFPAILYNLVIIKNNLKNTTDNILDNFKAYQRSYINLYRFKKAILKL